MRIVSLKLEHFRSYERAELRFGAGGGLTVLEGPNAAGKTNLLEAIWMLSGARSPRTSRDDQVVRDGADAARLACRFTSEAAAAGRERELVLLVERGRTTRKHWRLERVPKTTASIIGELTVVLFRPDDLDLLSRSSSYRRTYLDQLLSRSSREQAGLVRRVEQVLAQRRAALEALQQGLSADIESLNEQLVRDGAALAAARRSLLAAMQPTLQRVHTSVAGNDVALSVRIANPHIPAGTDDLQSIRQAFNAALAAEHAPEVSSGRNLVGPQRDDIEVYVRGRPLRDFGSRGEWRTAVVALKLAELEHLASVRGERPILLLDDVLSELDADRRRTLEPWFGQQQTVLATTDRHELSNDLLHTASVCSVVRGSVHDAEALTDAAAAL